MSISFCNVLLPPLENEHQTETGGYQAFSAFVHFLSFPSRIHFYLLIHTPTRKITFLNISSECKSFFQVPFSIFFVFFFLPK